MLEIELFSWAYDYMCEKGGYSDIINNKEINTIYGYVWLIRYF